MALYGKTDYWDDRYCKNTQPFDWYQRFYNFKDIVLNNVNKTQSNQILIVGCGNSRLGEQMIQEGYANITNIDNSIVCIKNMNQKFRESEKLKFICMDVKSLQFQNNKFDAVIDKALFDCILCSQNCSSIIQKMVSEIARVLKKNGIYIMISYQPPIRRLPYLQKSQYNWNVRVQQIAKPNSSNYNANIFDEGQVKSCHYIYICRKQG